jgi:HAMP domain-containing protein
MVDTAVAGSRATTKSSPQRVPVHRPFTVSVRVRILAWVLLVVALAMVVSGFATNTVLIARLDEQTDERLTSELAEFRTLAGRGIDPDTGLPLSVSTVDRLFRVALERNVPAGDETLFAVVSGDGVLRTTATARARIYDDPSFLAKLASVSAPAYGDISTTAGPVRYAAYPVRSGDQIAGVYVVAIFRDVERRQITEIMTTFAYVKAAALVLIALVGWLVAGRLLAPVRLLRETTQRLSETDLTRRIPVHGRDDVSELARTFNAMLDRLEESFATQRQFLDDVGHELRTPITIVRGHLELMSPSDDPDEHAETTALVLDELDRMSRLVDDLISWPRPSVRTSSASDRSGCSRSSRTCTRRRMASRVAPGSSPLRRRASCVRIGSDSPRRSSSWPTMPRSTRARVTGSSSVPRRAMVLYACLSPTRAPASTPQTPSTSSTGSSAAATAVGRLRALGSAWQSSAPSPRRTTGGSRSTPSPATAPQPMSVVQHPRPVGPYNLDEQPARPRRRFYHGAPMWSVGAQPQPHRADTQPEPGQQAAHRSRVHRRWQALQIRVVRHPPHADLDRSVLDDGDPIRNGSTNGGNERLGPRRASPSPPNAGVVADGYPARPVVDLARPPGHQLAARRVDSGG